MLRARAATLMSPEVGLPGLWECLRGGKPHPTKQVGSKEAQNSTEQRLLNH